MAEVEGEGAMASDRVKRIKMDTETLLQEDQEDPSAHLFNSLRVFTDGLERLKQVQTCGYRWQTAEMPTLATQWNTTA